MDKSCAVCYNAYMILTLRDAASIRCVKGAYKGIRRGNFPGLKKPLPHRAAVSFFGNNEKTVFCA